MNERYNKYKHEYPCPYATPSPSGHLSRSASNKSSLLPRISTESPERIPQNGASPLTEKKVRPLPVHNKEDVFNEWGAVLRHQDEIDK